MDDEDILLFFFNCTETYFNTILVEPSLWLLQVYGVDPAYLCCCKAG